MIIRDRCAVGDKSRRPTYLCVDRQPTLLPATQTRTRRCANSNLATAIVQLLSNGVCHCRVKADDDLLAACLFHWRLAAIPEVVGVRAGLVSVWQTECLVRAGLRRRLIDKNDSPRGQIYGRPRTLPRGRYTVSKRARLKTRIRQPMRLLGISTSGLAKRSGQPSANGWTGLVCLARLSCGSPNVLRCRKRGRQ